MIDQKVAAILGIMLAYELLTCSGQTVDKFYAISVMIMLISINIWSAETASANTMTKLMNGNN